MASYSAPSSGGGTQLGVASGRVTSGDVTPLPAGASFAAIPGFELPIAASIGDLVGVYPSFLSNAPTHFLDVGIKVGGSLVRFASSGTNTPSVEGDPGLYHDTTFLVAGGGAFLFEVESGDLSGGLVTFVMCTKGPGAGTLYASNNYPFRWHAVNYGAS